MGGACANDDVSVATPIRLSESGLYADARARTLADGIHSFAPAHPLWADGATKTRFISIPPGTKVDTSDLNHWVFPVGTKAWKEFRVGGRVVETRLLWKEREGAGFDRWWAAAYVWAPDGRRRGGDARGRA